MRYSQLREGRLKYSLNKMYVTFIHAFQVVEMTKVDEYMTVKERVNEQPTPADILFPKSLLLSQVLSSTAASVASLVDEYTSEAIAFMA